MTTTTDAATAGTEPPGTAPDDIDLTFVARLVPDLVVENVQGDQGERVVIGGPNRVMLLNPSAAVVFEFLDGEVTLGELAADVADALDVDPEQVGRDIVEFAQQLARAGLLEGISSPQVEIVFAPAASSPVADVGDSLLDEPFADFSGASRSLREFAGSKVLLVNWSPTCGFCTRIAPQLAQLEAPLRAENVELVFVTTGDEELNANVFAAAGNTAPVFLRAPGATAPFPWTGTPAAYVLDEDGVIAQPMRVGADQVPRVAADLAGVDAPDGSIAIDGVRYLPAPDAMCGPGGGGGASNATTWEGIRAYAFGDHHVGIKYDDVATAAVLDRLFRGARVDDARAPENYAVALGGTSTTTAPGTARSLNLLVRGSRVLVRSRSAARVLAALLQQLSAALRPGTDDDGSLLRVYATPVLSDDGRALLLPAALADHVQQLQPRLARAGFALPDVAEVLVDPTTAELVVPEPSIPFDASVLANVDADARLGPERPWARPGRYPIAAWLVVRGPDELGAMSPGVALTTVLGLVLGVETTERTLEVVALLTTMLEQVAVTATWYESPAELADQAREALGRT
jgi:thiol-disulfide isomerase/thioredoxin